MPSASATALPTKNDKSAKHPKLHVVEEAEVTGAVQGRITGVEYQDDDQVKASVKRLSHRYGYRFAKRTFDIAFSLLVLALFWVLPAYAGMIPRPRHRPRRSERCSPRMRG